MPCDIDPVGQEKTLARSVFRQRASDASTVGFGSSDGSGVAEGGKFVCLGSSGKMISVAFRSSIGRTAIARMRLAAARFFFKSFLRSDEAFCSESVVLQWFQGHLPNFAEFRLEVWTSIR